jgi:hypothetical protein
VQLAAKAAPGASHKPEIPRKPDHPCVASSRRKLARAANIEGNASMTAVSCPNISDDSASLTVIPLIVWRLQLQRRQLVSRLSTHDQSFESRKSGAHARRNSPPRSSGSPGKSMETFLEAPAAIASH